MRGLVFAPKFNTPGKRDADEFQREARKFVKLHLMPKPLGPPDGWREDPAAYVTLVDNRASLAARTDYVIGVLTGARGGYDVVAFFCHGSRRALQLCAGGAVLRLAGALRMLVPPVTPLVVPLYACSTAGAPNGAPGGDGGFADLLRDGIAIDGKGVRIYGHDRVGHTTRAPHVRLFQTPAGAGGFDLVRPGTLVWTKWKKRLRDPQDDLRLRYPLLTVEQLHAELRR